MSNKCINKEQPGRKGKHLRRIVLFLSLLLVQLASFTVQAQRRVTPVNPDRPVASKEKEQETDRSRLVTKKDVNGREFLVDTVTGKEFVDSAAIKDAQQKKPMLYPALYSATLGINIWDPVMSVFGQKYGLASVVAQVSFHNRYIPTFEFGLGKCDDTPAGLNYTYRSPTAPFFKIGCRYNFIYNSNPAYQAVGGISYGFTPFKFQVDDVTMQPGYWGDRPGFSIPSQSCTAGYLDVSFGVRVKIAGPVSAGWSLIYHKLLHESECPSGKPMYIPGYGKRTGHISGAITVSYTLPLAKKADPLPTDGTTD